MSREGVWYSETTRDGTLIEVPWDPYMGRHQDKIVYIDGEEAAVKNVQRYRDGGTTVIETDKGRIIIPSGLRPERRVTFDPAPLR